MNNRKIASLSAAAAVLVLTAGTALRAQSLDGLMTVRPGRSKAVTSSNTNMNSNRDNFPRISPGKTEVLADIKGPAVIRHIWLTFNEARPNWLEARGSAAPDEIVLRMYWDDAKEPAVEAPLGDFFAAGFGQRRRDPLGAGAGRRRRRLQLLLAHALLQARRSSPSPTRATRTSGASIITSTTTRNRPCRPQTAYFCAQYEPGLPGEARRGLSHPRRQGRRPLRRHRHVARAAGAPNGSAKATSGSTSTAKRSRPSRAPGPRITSSWPGASTRASFPYFGCNYVGDRTSATSGRRTASTAGTSPTPSGSPSPSGSTIEHTGWITGDETESGKIEGHVEREDDIATVAFWYQIGQPEPVHRPAARSPSADSRASTSSSRARRSSRRPGRREAGSSCRRDTTGRATDSSSSGPPASAACSRRTSTSRSPSTGRSSCG